MAANERAYTDALTGETVFTYHAPMTGLHADHAYVYEVFAAGSPAVSGRFRTAPKGRKPFRFSSFGDSRSRPRSAPASWWAHTRPTPVSSSTRSRRPILSSTCSTATFATPTFSDDPVATWRSFFGNNMRSARNRPWMPAAGNHENEAGNGAQGMDAYRNWFWLPDNGEHDDWQGNWYTFRVGNVGVVSLNNDDVCLQAGSFVPYRVANLGDKYRQDYLNGYTQGEQKACLQRTLLRLRADDGIDWIVVCMHQVAMSSAHFNGADLGIREEWLPLFERYGVDVVVAGHEHHYERSHAVHGCQLAGPTGVKLLTPEPRTSAIDVVDTTKGTVNMIIGGGGHSSPTPPTAFDAPHDGVVIYGVDTSGVVGGIGPRPALTTTEPGD